MAHPQETSSQTQEAAPYLSDQMLQLAQRICKNELEIELREPYTQYELWRNVRISLPGNLKAPLIFQDVKIEWNEYGTDFRVMAADYVLEERREDVLSTAYFRVDEADDPIVEDPFASYVYGAFRNAYRSHPHERCKPLILTDRHEMSLEALQQHSDIRTVPDTSYDI